MGGDHGAAEVVPGALAYARSHPEDTIILVGDEAVLARFAPTARPTCAPSTPRRWSRWTSIPRMALREKKDATILVAMDLVKQRARRTRS